MKSLPFGAVLVTANGHLYSQHWYFMAPELHGVLQRQREIESLKPNCPAKSKPGTPGNRAVDRRRTYSHANRSNMRAESADKKNREHALSMEALKLA